MRSPPILAIADAILAEGADDLLAVKANRPILRGEVESASRTSEGLDTLTDQDKGHGRVEQRPPDSPRLSHAS